MATEVDALGLRVDSTDALKATDALHDLADAAGKAEKAAEGVGKGSKRGAAGVGDLSKVVTKLNASLAGIDKAASALMGAANALTNAGRAGSSAAGDLSAVARELGNVTTEADTAGKSVTRTTRELEIFGAKGINAVVGITRELTGFEAMAARAAREAAYMSEQMRKLTEHEIRANDLAAYGAEMDRLRAKYNPLFALSKQYEVELDELNRAHRVGAISAQEHGNALTALNARFQQVANGADVAAASTKRGAAAMGGSMSGLAAQFQDIGVTAAMGMNPLIVGLQQGTQIAGQMEAAMQGGVKATQVFATAFKSLLGPVAAASIGLTIVATAIIQAVDWVAVGKRALGALADALEVIGPYAAMAAAGLALMYAPAILGGLASVTKALTLTAAAALRAAGAFLLANPAVAIVAGVAAAVAALYVFRDAIQSAVGVDVIGIVKRAGNTIIGSFVAAFEDIKFVWNNFGNVIGAAVIGGINIAIRAINDLIQAAFTGINFLVDAANKLGADISRVGESFGLTEIDNPYANLLGPAVAERNKAIAEAMGRDWIGEFIKGADAASAEAADWLRGLFDGNDKVDQKAAKAAQELRDYIVQAAMAARQVRELADAYLDGASAVARLTRQHEIEKQVLEHGEKARKGITSAINALAAANDRLDISKQIADLRQQNEAAAFYLMVLDQQSKGLAEGEAALAAYNKEQALSTLLLGKNAEEMADLVALYSEAWDQSAAIQTQADKIGELNELVESTKTKQEKFNDELKRLEGLRPFATQAEQVEALTRAIRQLQAENSTWVQLTDKAIERIDGAFADMWKGALDGSKNAFDVMTGGFKQMLAEMAHAAITRPIMITVGNAMTGRNEPGGMGGMLGNVQSATGLVNAFTGGTITALGSSIASVGATMGSAAATAFGSGVAAGAAGGFGTASAAVSGAMAAGGAAGTGAAAMGAMLGAVAPWAMGALALYSMFGDSFKGETRSGGSFWLQNDQVERLGGPSGGASQGATQFAEALLKQATETINRAFAAVDIDNALNGLIIAFEDSEKGRGGTYSFGDLSIDGQRFDFGAEGKGKGYGGTTGTLEEMMQNVEVDTWQTIIQAWQSAIHVFPDMMQDMIRGVDADALGMDAAKALAEQFIGTLEAINALSDALHSLPWVPATAHTFEFAAALAQAAGGVENASGLLTSFYQNYFTEAERMADLTGSLTTAFADMGRVMPSTREELRAQITEAMAMGDAGAETAAKLLALSQSFHTLTTYTDAQAAANAQLEEQAKATADALLKSIQGEAAGIEAQILQLQGDTVELRRRELEALHETNRPLQDRLYALRDEAEKLRIATAAQEEADRQRASLETQLLQLQGDTVALRNRELLALDSSNHALQRQIWALQDQQAAAEAAAQAARENVQAQRDALQNALAEYARAIDARKGELQTAFDAIADGFRASIASVQANVSELTSLVRRLASATASMRGTIDPMGSRQWAQGQLSNALAGARRGVMPTGANFEAALGILSRPSEDLYETFEDYQADFSKTAHDITTLNELATTQLTIEEKTLRSLQNQLEYAQKSHAEEIARYDAMLELQRTDVETALGTYTLTRDIAIISRDISIMLVGINSGINRLASASGEDASFAVGTNYVPYDMTAQIHKGEAIVPAKYNPAANPSLYQQSAPGIDSRAVQRERAEQRRIADLTYTNTKTLIKMQKIFDQWNTNGIPGERVEEFAP